MSILFIEYPTCSTCKKAKKFLKNQGCSLQERHIVTQTPTKEELTRWYKESNLPLKRFFNTSGNLYKEMNLKEKLPTMSEDEQLTLLSQHGMLIKRPLVISKDHIFVGFKEENYEKLCPEC
ncbi:arsenate reductase family protein [Amedibacillus sp. YH-ame10]